MVRRPHEFRDMVKALHRNGIEVIIDVVSKHAAEGGQRSSSPVFARAGQSYLLPPL